MPPTVASGAALGPLEEVEEVEEAGRPRRKGFGCCPRSPAKILHAIVLEILPEVVARVPFIPRTANYVADGRE